MYTNEKMKVVKFRKKERKEEEIWKMNYIISGIKW